MADSNVTLRAAGLLTQLRTQDPGLPAAGSLRGSQGERQAATLVEAAFLIAAADGHLQLEELGELATLVGGVLGGSVSPGDIATLLESFQDTLEKEGKAARITAIAAAATELEEQREILRFGSLVALCDNDLAPSELFVLHSLGRAFGMGAEEVNGILRPLKEALGHGSAEGALGPAPRRPLGPMPFTQAGARGSTPALKPGGSDGARAPRGEAPRGGARTGRENTQIVQGSPCEPPPGASPLIDPSPSLPPGFNLGVRAIGLSPRPSTLGERHCPWAGV